MAVFGFGRRNAVGRQYNGGNVSVMLPRYTTPPERNTRDWLEMFGRNPRLAVVDRIASDLSTCAGKLYRKDENGEEVEITDHPFLNFMAHPNPLYEMTWGACWRLQQIYLELKGEGYFVYEFDALGRPVELWPLPTHWVQQTPYVGYPYYEIRTTGGLIRQIPVDDIFCMKELNPLDPYKRGLGAAESLADEIETDEYAAKFQKKFFYNDATPTTLISMPGSSKDQRDRFRSEWNERFRGPFNSHGIATVDGNVTVTKLAENMRDMDMTEGRRFLRDAVLEHFGVPREIMGITESSNRATSEAAQYIYAQNVIMPRLNRREEAINTQILPFYGNDLVWHFDDVVPRSQEFDKAKGIDGWNAGLLLHLDLIEDINKFEMAKVSVEGGNAAFQCVKKVIELAMAGEVDATCTNALNKEAMNKALEYYHGEKSDGYTHFDGHTEIYATYTHTKKYTMMLAHHDLRVVHVSTHVSLREACDRVKKERVLEVIEIANKACKDMGIENPRIAVAGLNPHCGENGLFGREEIEEITPAIEAAKAEGITGVVGPCPPDSVFSQAIGGWYDIVVCMYHDQGHIPLKTVGFVYDREKQEWKAVEGVNVTLGLPIIRASVDHGTDFYHAGKGNGNELSLVNAIKYAVKMTGRAN